jgi:O-antigen ligase
MNDPAPNQLNSSAALWKQKPVPSRTSDRSAVDDTDQRLNTEQSKGESAAYRLTFICICLFSVLVTLRPQDFSSSLGDALPYAKVIAVIALIVYLGSKLQRGELPFIWPIEMQMMVLIALLAVVFAPLAASSNDTIDVLLDPFLKVLIIFAIMIDVVNSPKRLNILLNIVVICGALIALYTIESYLAGNFIKGRLVILRDSLFGNSNDLALIFDLLIPLAIVRALYKEKAERLLNVAAALLLGIGTLITFSRGGFLGLAAAGAVLMWKMARGNRLAPVIAVAVMLLALMFVVPGGYGERLTTIINVQEDETGSAQEREDLMVRAGTVALAHPLTGVGMGNFHTYSIHEKRAHNSFLEIAAELGIFGLIAFLVLIISPLKSLRKIERGVKDDANSPTFDQSPQRQELYYLSVGLQAVLVTYIVCSFFSSNQYFWYLYYPVAYTVALKRIYAAWASNPANVIENSVKKSSVTTWSSALSWKTGRKQSTGTTQIPVCDIDSPPIVAGGALWQQRQLTPTTETSSGVMWKR